jgi:predicted SnoaL-like aldol condensation-catalyzing enzyme
MDNKSNKELVLNFYRKVIGGRNPDLLDEYISDEYIQHSPLMKDGKAGLREAIEYLKTLPKATEVKSPIALAIAEDDYVVLLLDINFMGKHLSVADVFKVSDGMIVEHWDAVKDVTSSAASIPLFDIDENVEISEEKKTMIREHLDSSHGKVLRMITEGNVVGVQSEGEKSGKRFVFYDFVKIGDSKIIHSWRVEQEIPDTLNHNNGMI